MLSVGRKWENLFAKVDKKYALHLVIENCAPSVLEKMVKETEHRIWTAWTESLTQSTLPALYSTDISC
jgi:hypothetical protein